MKDLHLTIGHNVAGVPTHNTGDVCRACAGVLGIEAFTAVQCLGVWRGEAEASTRVEICAVSEAEAARIWQLLPDLAAVLGQVEIMAEVMPSRVRFVQASASTGAKTA